MGFKPVNQLTHHLESLFEELRSKKRELDRSILDLTFRCLDELRDYHRDLRSQGQSTVDLSELTTQVTEFLRATTPRVAQANPGIILAQTQAKTPQPQQPGTKTTATSSSAMVADSFRESDTITLVVIFQPNLPLVDMKARLVVNRLSTRAGILSTDPPLERLDDIDTLTRFTVCLTTEATHNELRSLADVEGVAETWIESPILNNPGTPTTKTIDQSRGKAEPVTSSIPPSQSLTIESFEPLVPVQLNTITKGPDGDLTSAKSPGSPTKVKVAETIRVESDRLDHLMNLAGELVITKARFIAIARGLDELFRRSNARTLTSDTRERLESLTRGLEGLLEIKSNSTGSSLDRWSVHIRQLRDNFRAIQDELDLIREARAAQVTHRDHSQLGSGL